MFETRRVAKSNCLQTRIKVLIDRYGVRIKGSLIQKHYGTSFIIQHQKDIEFTKLFDDINKLKQ